MKRPFRDYLCPKSLAGQLIVSLLLAIAVAQAVSVAIFASERREAIINARREQVLQRTASLVQMLDHLGGGRDAALTETILTAATSTRVRFWIAGESAVPGDDAEYRDNDLVRALHDRLGPRGGRPVLVQILDDGQRRFLKSPEFIRRIHRDWHDREEHGREAHDREHDRDDERGHDDHHDRHDRHDRDDRDDRDDDDRRPPMPVGLAWSVALGGGEWLNGQLAALPPRSWGPRTLTALALMMLAVSAVSILAVRRLTRPLGDLAQAADALGRGEVPPPLNPTGPGELRRTIAAFNTMQERLHRFVADRTRMLAAISHDLRTPLTSLRLRAEFIKDDEDNRRKILNILDEMERITEATLAFARDEQGGGDAVRADLAAICDAVAQELRDLGLDVSHASAGPVWLTCHPTALKRAIRNLAENAAHYGERARLSTQEADGEVRLIVEDDGPGIPEADHDNVFEPFTRLETSRSIETGGVGLGMAIARNIVRAHGGDISLENRAPKGLRATVSLPLPDDGG
jgi:signal transduction histidine kinase